MLTIDSLPSLRGIAEKIISGDDSGQLILFSFPSRQVWLKWRDYFVGAMSACLSEDGRGAIYEIITMDHCSETPQQELAEKLEFEEPTLDEILACYAGDPPIVIELDCGGQLKPAWQKFLLDLSRYYRTHDSIHSKRSICLFLSSPPFLPPIAPAPGVRSFAFWNPLQWEEVRLLFDENIGQTDNAISKSWAVSTYAGAANSDPEIIAKLLKQEPRSLREIRKIVRQYCTAQRSNETVSPSLSTFIDEKKWDVPQAVSNSWIQGQLHGHTFTRGNNIPWGEYCDPLLDSVLNRAIWREQVSGLFPLLMEVTKITSDLITQIKGAEWRKQINSNNGEMCLDTEPGKILDIFRSNKSLGRLPQKIYDILQRLRISRNKLAHLEPVDFCDVSQIWSLFGKISKFNR